MAKAEFTYEVRSIDQDPVGIEDYVVRTSDGEAVGTVADLLDRGGERLLVVESGVPAVGKRHAVSWGEVDRVDHDAVAVWLRHDQTAFERTALELDPSGAVEEGRGEAEARRIDETPADLLPPSLRRSRGPVDRSTWAKTLAAFALLSFSALAATMAVFLGGGGPWALVFLVPGALAIVTGVLAYRAYRNPYEPRGARKP